MDTMHDDEALPPPPILMRSKNIRQLVNMARAAARNPEKVYSESHPSGNTRFYVTVRPKTRGSRFKYQYATTRRAGRKRFTTIIDLDSMVLGGIESDVSPPTDPMSS
jgi:hypothetical protein